MNDTISKPNFKNSVTARLLVVIGLVLILIIPLSLVNNLVKERKIRQKGVTEEINKKWGGQVFVYGPMLELEYIDNQEVKKYDEKRQKEFVEIQEVRKKMYVFPEKLNISSEVDSKPKKIGNYETVVFSSENTLSGGFKLKTIKHKNIDWEKSKIILKTTNLKGIKDKISLNVNGGIYPFEANFSKMTFSKGKQLAYLSSSTLNIDKDLIKKDLNFKINLNHNGSEKVSFIPVGKITSVNMKSNWPNPSFKGEFLPNGNKNVNKKGFDVEWKILDINRPFSQVHYNKIPDLSSYSFGTGFIVTVDDYQQTERTTKYGMLIIGLTFLFFFLIQVMSKINIHVFQYLMVGIALIMFYTLLVSISEHSNFNISYLISTFSVVVMIGLYSKSVFKQVKFPLFITSSLMLLYGFVYVIIQLEKYALLFGSIGLFLILGIVMFISRKIEWQKM